MTATKVDYTNIFSQSWQNLFDLINNRSNVADPISTNSTSSFRKMVYSRDPDVKAIDFSDFPYIIVGTIGVDNTSGKFTVDAKKGQVDFTCNVEVVTCDRGVGNRDGKGAIDNDTISNDIYETLMSASNRTTLRMNGLPIARVNITPATPEPFNNTLVYRRTIVIGLSNKVMRVSA